MTKDKRPRDSQIKYRRDIDGLRAVAVLLVLGDHFRTHLSGGYVGVDVFFVISGYLISAAILKEMANGTFSVAAFYERRIRRIFPALIVMMLVVSALAYRFLFPVELADFARSLLAAMFSVSNFWFWHQSGYFDAPSALKPLLHTWSLGVEEQFYIVFPLLLVFIRRFAPSRIKLSVFLLFGATFALAILVVRRDASMAFFFSPLRAWELLLGTIVSQRYLPTIRSGIARNAATLTGLLFILVPAFLYTSATPFPGLSALPPCLGAALIIAGGETGDSLVGRLLSLPPVVGVGLISYSIYLWHWPVRVFQDIGHLVGALPPDDRRLKLAYFAISIVLGYLSWLLIETPFRKGAWRPGRRAIFVVNGLATAVVTALGLAMLWSHGAPGRFSPDALQAASYLSYNRMPDFRENLCFISDTADFNSYNPSACLVAREKDKPTVLLLGDSQVAQLLPGMIRIYPQWETLQATAAFCTVFPGEQLRVRPACGQLATLAFGDFLLNHHVDAVLYGGRWVDLDIPGIARSIAWMQQHGIRVFLFGPMIEYDEPFPRVLATSLREHRPQDVPAHLSARPRALDTTLSALARDQWHVPYISFYENLCTPVCPSYGAPGVPLLFDEHHFTAAGSVLFAQSMRDRHQLQVSAEPTGGALPLR